MRLIEMVGLPESVLDALPGQMSGGQRQRVAIARALSLNPDAIIADEPTSALDVSVRAQILNLLMDLKKQLGLAMVFISHDIQTVRYISDRIIVMNHGQAVEREPPKRCSTTRRTTTRACFWARLLASPPEPRERVSTGQQKRRATRKGRPFVC